ncbi:hypothetical protein MMC12_001459 [Toensbergia leucococca]|nr:hypothetical protein [Toensbergia leucococca]
MQTFYIDIDTANLRTILTVYFVAFSNLISFVGGKCLIKANIRRATSLRRVPIYRTTSWLSAMSIGEYVFKTRCLPGGSMGLLMLLSTIIAPLSHLLVSKFVTTVYKPGQCSFGSGLVIAQDASFFSDHRSTPTSAWLPARWAADAQSTSIRNGGLGGIYWKANEDPFFAADSDDVAGQWNCVDQMADTTYSAGTDFDTIFQDLFSKDLQYNDGVESHWALPHGVQVGMIIWSASVGDDVQQAWDVKISANTQLDQKETINMKNFHCSMSSTSIPWMLSYINSRSALKEWGQTLFGYLGGKVGDRNGDMSGKMEMVLNSMVMVSGSGNGANHTESEAKSPTQGCLVPKAQLPLPVTAMVGITGVFFLHLLIYLVSLGVATRPGALEELPDGVLGWQLQAVREASKEEEMNAGQAVRKDLLRVMNHVA